MKTYNRLFQQMCSFENLLNAAQKAQRGKRFQAEVARFNFHLEKELYHLQAELQTQTYRPGEYREFYIYEPKLRKISAAPYRDRVVHHALCNVVEPIFERTFIFDSYACRKDKGTHKAVDRFTEFSRKNTYVLKCDIRKYFPSIDHEILKTRFRRKIRDAQVLWLLDLIVDSSNPQEYVHEYFEGDDLLTSLNRRRGIPRGLKPRFPRLARRLLEQYSTKRAGRQSQQQHANEHEQQQRFSLCEDTLEGKLRHCVAPTELPELVCLRCRRVISSVH